MTIDFVPEGYEDKRTRVTPSIKFSTGDDGYKDATIYVDHIAVAFFDFQTGGLTLLPIEVSPSWGDEDLKYLESKGFKLNKQPHPWGKENYWVYYIQINEG